MSITLLFLVIALILFLLAACGVPSGPVALGWLGLFFLTVAMIVHLGFGR